MSIKDAIRRSRTLTTGSSESMMWEFLKSTAEQIISQNMAVYEAQLKEEVDKQIKILATKINREELRGKDGAPGRIGPKGDDGQSVVGPAGPQGLQGKPGQTIVGPAGEKGKDGSPDTPDQVVDKVNAAKKKVALSSIYGLPEELQNIRNVVRQSGRGVSKSGGMGNVQHELKSVSSASTTVSTTYKVAGGGNALWVTYNGQDMTKGTDYTVGTDQKTITLLFTPQNSTVMQITYIRT